MSIASAKPILFTNGKLFCRQDDGSVEFHSWMLVEDGIIVETGVASNSRRHELERNGIEVEDLKMSTVLPGFVDGHMHLLMLGQSLLKVDLWGCNNFDDIRNRIKDYAAKNPHVPRIMCRSWMNFMTDGKATAAMLDDLDDRPIFIDSRDLHSVWCNTAGLNDMGVEQWDLPPGGIIERDANGKPSGLVGEACVLTHVWPHLAKVASMDERKAALKGALDAYTKAGYTGVVDMAMDSHAWEAILALQESEPNLPTRVSAYWYIAPTEDVPGALAQVDKAIEMAQKFNDATSPNARILGIKVILDGVIDACRAAVSQPYSCDGSLPDALWEPEVLGPVIKKADAAGIQCAVHAIGDAAITMAINAIEHNTTPGRRHRIEHIELSSPEDAKRLGQLGITASIQPVHSDPAILRAWRNILGEDRLKRAFAYREFHDHGSPLAIGTDAPTAPHFPFANAYVATTRKSAKEPLQGDEPVNPEFTISLVQAMVGATHGVAYSTFAENKVGSLSVGKLADFIVVDYDVERNEDSERLRNAKVLQTWFGGRLIYSHVA